MPAWEYVVKQRLKVGQDEWLEPGDITLLPNTWHPSALRAHLNIGAIEKARLLPDVSYEEPAPASYAPQGYDELVPTPDPVVGERWPAPDLARLTCQNCRYINQLPATLLENRLSEWQCHSCNQVQSVASAQEHGVYVDYPVRAGFRQGGR